MEGGGITETQAVVGTYTPSRDPTAIHVGSKEDCQPISAAAMPRSATSCVIGSKGGKDGGGGRKEASAYPGGYAVPTMVLMVSREQCADEAPTRSKEE